MLPLSAARASAQAIFLLLEKNIQEKHSPHKPRRICNPGFILQTNVFSVWYFWFF
jgi:hypothetical protein